MPHSASRDKGWSQRLRRAEASVARWPEDLAGAKAMQETTRQAHALAGLKPGPEKGNEII